MANSKNPTDNQVITAVVNEQRVINTEAALIVGRVLTWEELLGAYMRSKSNLPFSKWYSLVIAYGVKTINPITNEMSRVINKTAKGLNQIDNMAVKNINPVKATAITSSQKLMGKTNDQLIATWKISTLNFLRSELIRLNANGVDNIGISKALIGTASQGYKNGSLFKAVNNSNSTMTTAIKATTEAMRSERYQDDAGVQGYLYLATLDGATTQICQSLHGKRFYYYRIDSKGNKTYLSGMKPIPPQHYGCRSVTQPIYEGEPPPKVDTTFEQWAADPDNDAELLESLGRNRYDLYKSGKIQVRRFTDARFQPLTLEELSKAGFNTPYGDK